MNSLARYVQDESLDPVAVIWWCRDKRLISDNCATLDTVAECDAAKAVQVIQEARKRKALTTANGTA